MKKIASAVAAIAALGCTSSANAADLPVKAVKAPIAVPYNWTGFYVGLNAGGAFGNKYSEDPTGLFSGYAGTPRLPTSENQSAFTGGLQIGYNWQFNQVVAGIEADFNYVGFRDTTFTVTGLPGTPFGFGAAPNVFNYAHSASKFFGTLRGRLGYAADRALIYVTGGLAYSNRSNNGVASFTNAGGVQYATFTGSSSRNIGYAVGGGVEYAWLNNWSIKGEYLFVSINHHNETLADPVTPIGAGYTFSSTVGEQFSVVRVGLNYKFM